MYSDQRIRENTKHLIKTYLLPFDRYKKESYNFKGMLGRGFLVIVDSFDGTEYILNHSRLTMKNLHLNSPHSLSFSMQHNYTIPFALDFDCVQCTNKLPHEAVSEEGIRNFVNTVDSLLTKLLPPQREKNLQLKFYSLKSSAKCNFHLYFNQSISLLMEEFLRLWFTEVMVNTKFCDKFILDDVQTLGLPFSGKEFDSKYDLLHTNDVEWRKTSVLTDFYYELDLFYEIGNTSTFSVVVELEDCCLVSRLEPDVVQRSVEEEMDSLIQLLRRIRYFDHTYIAGSLKYKISNNYPKLVDFIANEL